MNSFKPDRAFRSTLISVAVLGITLCLRAPAGPPPSRKPAVPSSSAARTVPPVSSSAPAQDEMAHMHFLGGFRGSGRTHVVTGGRFEYREKDAVITGDIARWDDSKKILDASGHLVFDDPSHHATGDRAHVEDQKGLSDIRENVILILKPQGSVGSGGEALGTGGGAAGAGSGHDADADSMKRHGVKVTCDHVEDEYRRKYVKLFGHLTFFQSFVDDEGKSVERTVTAQHAEYDGKAETMTFYPPVEGHDNRGQTFKSAKEVMRVGTKSGDEWIDGKDAIMNFLPQHRDEEATPQAAGSPKER